MNTLQRPIRELSVVEYDLVYGADYDIKRAAVVKGCDIAGTNVGKAIGGVIGAPVGGFLGSLTGNPVITGIGVVSGGIIGSSVGGLAGGEALGYVCGVAYDYMNDPTGVDYCGCNYH